jgi:hypothetical protein
MAESVATSPFANDSPDPVVHYSPVVQHHIVHAIGNHGSAIAYEIDHGTVDHEHSTRDYIGRSRGDLPIAVNISKEVKEPH